MAIDKKTSIFFAGGKRVEPQSNDNVKGLRFERKTDGSWTLSLELSIDAAEATNVIRRFSDFTIENSDGSMAQVAESELDKLFPNQVYFVAFDNDGESIDIKLDKAKLSVVYDKEESGEIIFSVAPRGTGKTQNNKTQNVIVN